MNKKRVNDWIDIAKEALKDVGLVSDGKIDKTNRGQISSFGAAVAMGSLKSAVAFFSDNGNAEGERSKLLQAMYYCIKNGDVYDNDRIIDASKIFDEICKKNESEYKELFLDASVALKLAMNFYDMGNSQEDKKNKG